MKHKIKRMLALAAVMTFMFSTVVFAVEANLTGGGTAKLLAEEDSAGMKKCYAETECGYGNVYASIDYWTYYFDGSEDEYNSGCELGYAINPRYDIWEWAEDYKCIHKVYNASKVSQDSVTLYED